VIIPIPKSNSAPEVQQAMFDQAAKLRKALEGKARLGVLGEHPFETAWPSSCFGSCAQGGCGFWVRHSVFLSVRALGRDESWY
jgi:hypothetical protein